MAQVFCGETVEFTVFSASSGTRVTVFQKFKEFD